MTDVQTTTDAERHEEATERPRSAKTRRVVLLGAGAAGATAVLAACGTGSSSTNSNGTDFSDNPGPAGSAGPGGGSNGGSNGGSGGATLAAVGDVPEGGGIIAGDYVITQPVAGTFKAFSKVCTHAGCDVSKIDGGQITCPCHNSKFSIDTGEPTSGPATKALPATEVKVDGDNIVAA
ncbi:Rieske (2Fe-2S) protein [Actinoplanes sp. TRM 88003]|uniref:Cytochrome bc1 complex Rieske iron-sulfur subunit n=1 Tax=Paractinoplanes aksuensis TaxID=2939490 RepID=A0ABT1DZK5_9ACTN|nr:Rieske (2Fe-2S) protein [Actinoplanes aksuensis]MCO8276309.1 Rieske (2Fe-2S) protein [Actinoplanes aksuensis]